MRLYGLRPLNFRNVCLFLASVFPYCFCNEAKILPLCATDNADHAAQTKNLLFVSTLDGKVTALDARDGTQHWQVQAGDSLLSSSIHRLELKQEGVWARFVPSLSGSLYTFSEKSLEYSISAEQLLSASRRYSDDLVIAGGKETSSYGVSAKSGKVVYECSLNGCVNSTGWKDGGTEQIEEDGEMILIKRVSQTVRAIEFRSGQERWNFSVGQHELSFTPAATRCVLPTPPIKLDTPEVIYKVVVPEGLVCAVQKDAPHIVVWKHKLMTPIVGAWQYEEHQLKSLDLFGMAYSPALDSSEADPHPFGSYVTPSVYIGMHDRQLYIQESVRMQALVRNVIEPHLAIGQGPHRHQSYLIPWKPVSARVAHGWHPSDEETALVLSEKEYATTALSVLYASEYVNGNGYFLFSEEDRLAIDDPRCDRMNTSLIETGDQHSDEIELDDEEEGHIWSDDEPFNVVVMSLWYWWKEVSLIALTTAIFVNFLSHKFRRWFTPPEIHRTYVVLERPVPVSPAPLSLPPYQEPSPPPFTSRYLTDFQPLQCLGRGGFGIVFEAKNKIDDCSYAVKRITLPYRKDKREKVLREVRALAKLEHSHIVRYFNAWLEEPPFGWEDPFERELKSQLEFTETFSKVPMSGSNVKKKLKQSVGFDLKGDSLLSKRSIKTGDTFNEFSRQRSYSMNDSISIVFERTKDNSNDFSENSMEPTSSFRKSSFKEENGDDDEDDDSFIVFANPDEDCDVNSNHDIKRKGDSIISISDSDFEVKPKENGMSEPKNTECVIIDESQICGKFRKRHRKHLSLDLQSNSCSTPLPMKQMYLYIQMQLCRTESLKDWLKENTCLEVRKSQVVTIFEQIVHAVEYVHLQGLIHRDLKPSNIFFAFDGRIKIGDFGLVTTMIDPLSLDQPRSPVFGLSDIAHDRHTQHVGTHLYMSPEQVRGEAHGYKVDIWSLGLVLAELLIPFSTEMERVLTLKDIRDHKFPKDFKSTFPQEHSLLQLMLSQEPAQRPSTLGVRARAPLLHTTDPRYHFSLPPPVSRSSSTSSSLSRSTSGSST